MNRPAPETNASTQTAAHRPGSTIASSVEQVADTYTSQFSEKAGRLPNLTLAFVIFLTIGFPFFFGGMQPYINLTVQMLAYALIVLWLLTAREPCSRAVANSTSAKLILSGLTLFLVYSGVQLLFLLISKQEHPILGSAYRAASLHDGISALRQIGCFTAVFFVTTAALHSASRFAARLKALLLLAALLVALTALAHWFYDNGRLFGIFEPENVFISERARWPFVNSNHLGHFLLPLFFVSLAEVALQVRSFSEFQWKFKGGASLSWSQLLAHKKTQTKIAALMFAVMLPLIIFLAVLASLSRGAWLGFSLGLLIFTFFFPRPEKPQNHSSSRTHGHHHSKSGRAPFELSPGRLAAKLGRMVKPLACLVAALLVYFFISGRGAELLEERIEYGLLYSMDDLRWKLFDNTLPMIKEHFLTGVGPGQWSHLFPRYMDPLLAGINPVYLHSDPLQLLAESGFLGFLIVTLTLAITAWLCLKKRKAGNYRDEVLKLSLLSGLVALLAASWFDFPFRIPAITACVGILLALTAFYQDRDPISK